MPRDLSRTAIKCFALQCVSQIVIAGPTFAPCRTIRDSKESSSEDFQPRVHGKKRAKKRD